MSPSERYQAMLRSARDAGVTPTKRALAEMYGGEAGEIIYNLQNEVDRLQRVIGDMVSEKLRAST